MTTGWINDKSEHVQKTLQGFKTAGRVAWCGAAKHGKMHLIEKCSETNSRDSCSHTHPNASNSTKLEQIHGETSRQNKHRLQKPQSRMWDQINRDMQVPSTYQPGLCGQDAAFLQQFWQQWRWRRCGFLAKELLLGSVIQQWPVTCGVITESRRLRDHQSDWSWSLATERGQHGNPAVTVTLHPSSTGSGRLALWI